MVLRKCVLSMLQVGQREREKRNSTLYPLNPYYLNKNQIKSMTIMYIYFRNV